MHFLTHPVTVQRCSSVLFSHRIQLLQRVKAQGRCLPKCFPAVKIKILIKDKFVVLLGALPEADARLPVMRYMGQPNE